MSEHVFGETTIQDWDHSPDDVKGKTYHLTAEAKCSCGEVAWFTTGQHKDRSDAHILVQFEMMRPIVEVLKQRHTEKVGKKKPIRKLKKAVKK